MVVCLFQISLFYVFLPDFLTVDSVSRAETESDWGDESVDSTEIVLGLNFPKLSSVSKASSLGW